MEAGRMTLDADELIMEQLGLKESKETEGGAAINTSAQVN